MRRKILIMAVPLMLVIITASWGCDILGLYQEEEPGASAYTGDYKNDFTLEGLDGKETSISDFAGDVVVLNFWATWCPPCRAEIPDFIEVFSDYQDKGVQFIGISNEDKGTLEAFVDDYGINYPILVDRSDIGGQWDVRAIPTTFILDESGEIVFKNVGMMTGSQLEAAIQEALEGP